MKSKYLSKSIDDPLGLRGQVKEPFSEILGDDREIPGDRKTVINDIALDSWIAAHYGTTLDKVEYSKPPNMNRYVHKRIMKTKSLYYPYPKNQDESIEKSPEKPKLPNKKANGTVFDIKGLDSTTVATLKGAI